jgi:hypothetical protein
MKHLLAVADDFIVNRPGLPENRRIDVIGIRLDPDGELSSINHIKNAVEGL